MLPLPPQTELQNAHFVLGRVLGQGGFGITYEATDTVLHRTVAIKEFFPPGCGREGARAAPAGPGSAEFAAARQAFIAEARTLAQFAHPHIVAVYRVFEENGTAYMVMEYIPGQSLQQVVETHGPLPPAEIPGILQPVCEAVAAVHRAGLLHGDIKPGNIMRHENGRIVLLDFGLTRRLEPNRYATIALASGRFGTAGYAPLEQYGHDAELGPYSDIYALSATLYFLLTGQAPPAATDRAIGAGLMVPAPGQPQLNRLIGRGMAMHPDERPQTVEQFLEMAGQEETRQTQMDVLPAPGAARWEEDEPAPVLEGEVIPAGSSRTGTGSWPGPGSRQRGGGVRGNRQSARYYERLDPAPRATVVTGSGCPLTCCGCGCLAVIVAFSVAGALVGSFFDILVSIGGG